MTVVKIGIHDYTINYVSEHEIGRIKDTNVRLDGFINHERKEIYINKDLTEKGQQETLIHEVLHGIIGEWNIDKNLNINEELEEKLVTTLAKGLVQVLEQSNLMDTLKDSESDFIRNGQRQ